LSAVALVVFGLERIEDTPVLAQYLLEEFAAGRKKSRWARCQKTWNPAKFSLSKLKRHRMGLSKF